MMTPKPGQVRCPTCHRSTPPSGFCTQCGAALPASLRARPRGLDRDELDQRIRTRRPGDLPFRRGVPVGEPGDYQPFRPEPFQAEPEDALVRQPGAPGGEAEPRVDNTPPDFDEVPAEPPVVPVRPVAAVPPAAAVPLAAATPSVAPLPRARAPRPVRAAAAARPAAISREVYKAAEPDEQPYSAYTYPEERRSGLVGPLAIVAFVALGLMAIGVGAVLSGMFAGAASATPAPTPLVSQSPPTVSPSVGGSPSVTSVPTPSVAPTPVLPVVFPDGFTANAQPCAEQPTSFDGCNSSGSTVSSGTVWVWVGFRNGGKGDMLTVTILDSAGSAVHDATIDLGGICASCNGYVRFRFSGLSPGSYTIRVDRNDQLADAAKFTVAG
ncbi:MAG: hypothetical protein M3O78_04860 [Chloroflexota bacterium]|nr:hypothetical protein [Chloroflexota bacterium]